MSQPRKHVRNQTVVMLTLDGFPRRQVAQWMGLTRARVYSILDDEVTLQAIARKLRALT